MSDSYFIEVSWFGDRASRLPKHIGPFKTHGEASEFGELNVVGSGGIYEVLRLAYPYSKTTDEA